jgi:hypothetical protein
MKGWLFGSVVVVGLVVLAGTVVQGQGKKAPASKYQWHTSYESAREEARRTGKPLMIVFRCEP